MISKVILSLEQKNFGNRKKLSQLKIKISLKTKMHQSNLFLKTQKIEF